MNNPKSIYNALICLFVFSAFIFAVNPSFAADNIFVSTQGNDSWNGQSAIYDSTTGDGPKATITSAINTVNNNGTIYIASGTYKENLNVYIKSVNLIGEDPETTIIDGQQKSGVLYFAGWDTIHYYTMIISGLTLTNGKKDKGGGIYNDNGTIYLLNSKITGNIATKEGGGIFNIGTIYVDSSTEISGNIKQGSMQNEPDNVFGNPLIELATAPEPLPNNNTDVNGPAVTNQPTTTGNNIPLPATGIPLAVLALAVGLVGVGSLKGFKW